MEFTLVTTVFNEAKRLHQTIKDIENQVVKPGELVIVDAGSKDGTLDILKNWAAISTIKLKIIVEPKCNVARGRNIAIQNASNALIVSTDFGCRFHPNWLESIVTPFENAEVEVVGGAFTVQEEEVDTLAAKADYVLQKGYPVVMDIFFSVSSRSIAYKKQVWEKLNGYPEWLTLAADDTIFWKLIKKARFNYVFVDKPYVYWLRHKTFKAFGKEDFRYGLGDGEGKINQRNVLSKILETGIRYTLFLNILLMPFTLAVAPVLVLLLLLIQLPGLRSYYWAYRNWSDLKSSKFNFNVFLACLYLTEVARLNYIKGYWKGYFNNNTKKQQESRNLQQRLA